MTRLLLDTHVLLWVLLSPERIPAPTRELLAEPSCELAVSAASAWEIATKVRLGKLPDAQGVALGYDAHLVRLRATEVPVTSRHALLAGSMEWDHRDPFDRLIAAQCIVEAFGLVTADRALASLPTVDIVW